MRQFFNTVDDALRTGAAWTANLVQVLTLAGVVVLAVAIMLCLYRLLRGPRLADRAAALDVIGVQFIGLITLLTILGGTLLYVDGVLVLALLSFAGTIAAAQFIARPHVVGSHVESDPAEDDSPDVANVEKSKAIDQEARS